MTSVKCLINERDLITSHRGKENSIKYSNSMVSGYLRCLRDPIPCSLLNAETRCCDTNNNCEGYCCISDGFPI